MHQSASDSIGFKIPGLHDCSARRRPGPRWHGSSRCWTSRSGPDLRSDGGDIELVGIDEDRIVQVRLKGACQGCSSSLITITMRVESTLKAAVPEIRFVEAVP